METSGGRIVVIGVGHRDRGDDGIGPAIVDEVAAREIGVRTVVREGDLADLLTEWGPDDAVVIVDAFRSDRPAGEIVEIDPGDQCNSAGTSTHGVGVAFGVELARRLGRQPDRLLVLAVTGQHFDLAR